GLLRWRRNSSARLHLKRKLTLLTFLPVTALAPGDAQARGSSRRKATMALPQSPARKQLLRDRARFMRHHPTYSEHLLWSAIRGKRQGVQFRRQQVIGNHIVDFLCRKAALVVEVDGDSYHAQQLALDARRDAKLRRAGFRVLRVPASLVETDL